jgi:hypothetical protein
MSKCHTGGGGGVRKLPKMCHVLFELPLMIFSPIFIGQGKLWTQRKFFFLIDNIGWQIEILGLKTEKL